MTIFLQKTASVPKSTSPSNALSFRKLAAELALHDRLDDLGIGILAAPSVMEGAGSLMQKTPWAGMRGAGAALHGLGETLHSSPAYNLPGYALVAPTFTHGLADMLTDTPSAEKRAGMLQALSLLKL